MKKIISILLFACAGALAACDFLDVVPEGQATQEDIFKTSKEARKYLNTLYTYAPNIAAYRYMPDFCAGDDIITATNGQTRYFPYKSMLYNEENASQTYYGLWDATTSSPSGRTNYDMYKGIRYCYIMIDNIDAVPGISPSVADEFKGEALFSDRLLPLGAADSLRPGHPRQGAAGHGASRGAGLCGPQSVRRMRDVHRRDLRPRGRFAARVSDAVPMPTWGAPPRWRPRR